MRLGERRPHRVQFLRIVRVVVVDGGDEGGMVGGLGAWIDPLKTALDAAEGQERGTGLGFVAAEGQRHLKREKGVVAVVLARD